MDSHAVLLPGVALVNPAGVGERSLISQGGPGEAAQVWTDQADVAPPSILHGHIDYCVGEGAANQPAVLSILAVGPGDLISFWKLTVHPDISLQVRETWKHLRPTWSKQKCRHWVHVLSLMRHYYPAEEETGRGEQVKLHGG